jgi:hypothetical protein
VYHAELSQGAHVMRKFNMSSSELTSLILVPWCKGEIIEIEDHAYDPAHASLSIFEARELRLDELSMGRGWPNAMKYGEDVTTRMIKEAGSLDATQQTALESFKERVLAQCGSGRIGVHQVMWLANSEYPAVRASERLALAEQSIWELLYQGRLRMLTAAGTTVSPADWERVVLNWDTWAEPNAPSTLLEATHPAA